LKTLQRKSQSHHHRHHCQKNSNHHEFPAYGNFDVNETNDHILLVRFKCSNLNRSLCGTKTMKKQNA
jgi:hypothetical protein